VPIFKRARFSRVPLAMLDVFNFFFFFWGTAILGMSIYSRSICGSVRW